MNQLFTARYIDMPEGLAFVEEWGEGVPLLCIHSAGQSGVQYRRAAATLASLGYRVIVPDLPGHGRSEPHRDGAVVDLGLYAEWLIALSQVLELDRPVIVGCSIGGKITIDIATRMGTAIRAAYAMSATAAPGHISLSGLRRELEDVAAPSRTDRTYYGTRAVVGSAATEQKRELIARMHSREDPEVSTSDLLGWSSHSILGRLASIAVPFHLVIGADDLWVPRELGEQTASAIPNADFSYLIGVGHYPMEELAEFPSMLDTWLRSREVVQ